MTARAVTMKADHMHLFQAAVTFQNEMKVWKRPIFALTPIHTGHVPITISARGNTAVTAQGNPTTTYVLQENTVYSILPSTNKWTSKTNLPDNIGYSCVSMSNDKKYVYFAGGSYPANSYGESLKSIHRWDIAANKMDTLAATMSVGRCCFGCIVSSLDDNLYVMG